ncbi:hypothetical protein HNV10_12615 [Winogradskyella litoriviva]|uniref:Uncharacterized protein n=1 Tax=Winogradskyella litoriviva TaxID=1220182 RepID=A0ABX2E6L5_9FLAO|nr:hypothetical protein [Winogradskyella litoriviva]NRD24095.1 hypothetical protein [Winogradskyella litoriviva]
MKKLTISFCFLLISSFCFGQLKISTDSRTDYSWDNNSEDWVFESEDSESLTFFEFNESFTMVKHTTESGTSGYLIKSQEHDEENGNNQYLMSILSDAGNKYIMIFDVKNRSIRFITEDTSTMIKFKIKNIWKDE